MRLHFKISQRRLFFHNSPQHYSIDAFLLNNSGPYSVKHSTPQPAHLQKVYEKTIKEYPEARMMVSQSQGSLLTILCRLMNANKVLELGSFTGYSTLCLAEGIKERGSSAKVVCCEKNEEYAKVALQNVKDAGMGEIVEIRIGNALDMLVLFIYSGNVFDFFG